MKIEIPDPQIIPLLTSDKGFTRIHPTKNVIGRADDKTLSFYNFDGELIHEIAFEAPVKDFAFHPSGKYMAIVYNGLIEIISVRDILIAVSPFRVRVVFDDIKMLGPEQVVFHANGKLLAVRINKGICIIEVDENPSFFIDNLVGKVKTTTCFPRDIHFHPSESVLGVCGNTKLIYFYDVSGEIGKPVKYKFDRDTLQKIRFVDGGEKVVVSTQRWSGNRYFDFFLKSLTNEKEGSQIENLPFLEISQIAISPEGSLLVLAAREKLLIVDVKNLAVVKEIDFKRIVTELEFSPRGDKLMASWEKGVALSSANKKKTRSCILDFGQPLGKRDPRLPGAFNPDMV